MKNRGFTLIELLVVIAIIGILSSVVLASLNSARNKGADAAIKANLANARAEAEIFYDTASVPTYAGVCAGSGANTIGDNVTAALNAASDSAALTSRCFDDANEWVAFSQLKSTPTSFYCVDYTGTATTTAAVPFTTEVDGSINCN